MLNVHSYAASTAVPCQIWGTGTMTWAAQHGIVDADAAHVVEDKNQCKINPWVGSGLEIDICIEQLRCILGDVLGNGPSRESYITS